jgi:bifunctional non-homologous end joining protein LigD
MPASLSTYQAKRNFKETREPRGQGAGKRRVAKAEYPRFVIQKHVATRLHYDLRLEVDGVFKSWAVTRGPSLDPKEKRLAVEVEDHPLEYGDFEGTIPKGQYGGGTVMLWDRGFWSPESDNALDALAKGELKFTIAGSKLKGSWALVRMKGDKYGGKANNWLLIKHRDEWAIAGDDEGVLKSDRSVASRRTMNQIAKGRGGAPAPFMMAGGTAKSDAVWDSNDTDAAKRSAANAKRSTSSAGQPRAAKAAGEKSAKTTSAKPNGSAHAGTASGFVIQGVSISKPDKLLWPKEDANVSKKAYAEYLAQTGPWMLEHIRGRPCSILRAPDGITGEMFFQRHAMQGQAASIKSVKVDGDHAPYLQIDNIEAVLAIGQVAGLEFHPWNCQPNEPDVPGRLIFDFDPAPGVEFSKVVQAAKEMRDRLEKLGLVSFCKTTGGKGLHVVTPLKTKPSDTLGWKDAKNFTQAISLQMAADSPGLYLTKMTKRLRTGKIFIDYLRNDRTATAVAPLSARARPGACVSMPVSWTQVRNDLDPKRYTVYSAPVLLAKSDPWPDYKTAGRPLLSAIKKLTGGKS